MRHCLGSLDEQIDLGDFIVGIVGKLTPELFSRYKPEGNSCWLGNWKIAIVGFTFHLQPEPWSGRRNHMITQSSVRKKALLAKALDCKLSDFISPRGQHKGMIIRRRNPPGRIPNLNPLYLVCFI